MATTKLSLYKIACRAIGERPVSSLSEDSETRRLLDEVWDSDAIKYVLEEGLWNFAMRTSKIDSSSSVSTEFAFAYAFDLPSDFVRLNNISSDEYFTDPLLQYEVEGPYIYADVDPIYFRYVSDHTDFGNDLSLWPQTVSLWAGYWLGTQVAPALKNDLDMERLEKRTNKYLVDARSKDAQQEPTRFPPEGSWVRARHGWRGGRRDRGSRSRLIG